MTLRLIHAQECAPQPWRNGGGQTRELLVWPPEGEWQLRISRADIAADGPFSAFPGVQRWFVLLSGEGVVLDFDNHGLALRPGDTPLAFAGAAAPGCRLMGGPVRDLNLMCRGGSGGLAAVWPGAAWQPGPVAPHQRPASLAIRPPHCAGTAQPGRGFA